MNRDIASTKCNECKSYNALCRDCRFAKYDAMKEETSNEFKEKFDPKPCEDITEFIESHTANTKSNDDPLVYNQKCRKCKKEFPRLNKEIMLCRNCQDQNYEWRGWYKSQEGEI